MIVYAPAFEVCRRADGSVEMLDGLPAIRTRGELRYLHTDGFEVVVPATEEKPRPNETATDYVLRNAAEKAADVAGRARSQGVPCTTDTAYSLTPAEAIVDAARAHQCDLIVMGSHGQRGLSDRLAGSVTQHVLRYSAVPVMVLRPPLEDAVDNARF